MILKRMDEVILAGQYEVVSGEDDEVRVTLIAPGWVQVGDKPRVSWREVGSGYASRRALFYDDTADPSNKLFTSWQNYYKTSGGEMPYAGCGSMYKNNLPCFGGIAKAAVYWRYSQGFREYLESFDPEAAVCLRSEDETQFRSLQEKNCKLPADWTQKYKSADGAWLLPVVATLSSGKYLVLGLQPDACGEDCGDLPEMNVDIVRSQEIMRMLRRPESSDREMLSDLFQMASGLGRNPFGKDLKPDFPNAEYLRLMGIVPAASRMALLDFWNTRAEYRIKFAPNPDNSCLLFLPEGEMKFAELKAHIDAENQRKKRYFEAKKNKSKRIAEDVEPEEVQRPSAIPVDRRATVFLANIEGGQKKKLIVQQTVPAVSVRYFAALNEELLTGNLQYVLVQYMKTALTGQDGDVPSVYRYWTEVFSRALQKQFISARTAYDSFPRFARSMSGEKLIEDAAARIYLRLIGKMLRLAHLIAVARETPDRLGSMDLAQELDEIEKYQRLPKQGVLDKMTLQPPSGESLLGTNYALLRENERSRFDRFVKDSFAGVPDEDFRLFARGALTGMLLRNLCFCVTREGRRFSVTQGRHPTRLRGAEITALFVKGVGLLSNLGKEQTFNNRMLPFIRSVEAESLRDAFNSGMIMGMVYFEPKDNDDKIQNKGESEND